MKVGMLWNNTIDNHAALLRLLLADGISPRTTNPEHGNQSLLHCAAHFGALDVIRLLLETGAEANSCDLLGNTPLHTAVTHGELACARELIPHTDLRSYSADGNNVLHASIICNQPEIFKLLLPHFADNIDVRTIKPRPPADPDGPYNGTALYLACQGGYHAMVKALLAAGASRTAHNTHSFSCLHMAAQEGHLASLTLLIGRPENRKMSATEIDARGMYGAAPLYLAAQNGHRYCCAALLAAGADPAATTHEGLTALDAAKRFNPGNKELIELLECRSGGPAPLLCAGCGTSDKCLRACSACGSAAFCSDACMARFWPVHKAECRRIQAENEEKARSHIIIQYSRDMPAPP